MAHSFGAAPRFGEYCEWALSVGCDVRSGVSSPDLKGVTRITAPGGRVLMQVGLEKDEVLDRRTVASFDRRLGLDSPFPKAPSGY